MEVAHDLAVEALARDLRSRSQLEWELLIIADWPIYSVGPWPKERHAPFASALPPERWCRQVRDAREVVLRELRLGGHQAAIEKAEEDVKTLASNVGLNAARYWTDIPGIPMHVQAAKSVLWITAIYPLLTEDQFQRLWEPYASVAGYLRDFRTAYLPVRAEQLASPQRGRLNRLLGRR